MLENDYQAYLVRNLLPGMFPGIVILKNDSSYLPGVPDLLLLYRGCWAMLEVKKEKPTKASDWRPNQEHYLAVFDEMSFASCIYPENEQEVLNALQQAFQPRRAARLSQSQ